MQQLTRVIESEKRRALVGAFVGFVVGFVVAGTYFALTNSTLEQPWQGNPPTVEEMRAAEIQSFLIGGTIFGTLGACLTALVSFVIYKCRR